MTTSPKKAEKKPLRPDDRRVGTEKERLMKAGASEEKADAFVQAFKNLRKSTAKGKLTAIIPDLGDIAKAASLTKEQTKEISKIGKDFKVGLKDALNMYVYFKADQETVDKLTKVCSVMFKEK